MKLFKNIFIIIAVCLSANLYAQSNQFNYQAVLRDASGAVLENQNVALTFSIREGSSSGTVVYAETHNASTNNQGLVNLFIGGGTTISGVFSDIDWSANRHYLTVNLNGTDMGSSEFKSVPYALYAEHAGNVVWELNGAAVYYNTGSVGIGTSTPVDRLHVVDGSGGTRVRIEETGNGYAGVVSRNNIGEYFVGVQGTFDANPGDFQVYDNVSSAQRLAIMGNGNVGIGESNPEEKLDVNGAVRVQEESSTPEVNTLYGNLLPLAYGFVGGNGTVFFEVGVASFTRTGVGAYTIVLDNPVVGQEMVMTANFSDLNSNGGLINTFPQVSPSAMLVKTYDINGASVDRQFSFVIYGNAQ